MINNKKIIMNEHDEKIAACSIIGTVTIQVGVYVVYKLIKFAIKKNK